ncbi:MAG: hypothetical protein V3V59_09435, partial [Thermodesulfovibrionales bacterium]
SKLLTMTIENKILKRISKAAHNTPDPSRAERNLIRLFEEVPDVNRFTTHLAITAKLFAVSQFLANFCFASPDDLFSALRER